MRCVEKYSLEMWIDLRSNKEIYECTELLQE
jgi:hypothetical protein